MGVPILDLGPSKLSTVVQDLFRTVISQGEDPMPHLSKLQFAHAQLNSGEQLSDKILA
jgi:hypothetical protein